MHELWTIRTTNMIDTRSQNYTNMVAIEHRTRNSKLWLLCCCFWYCCLMFLSPQVHIPYDLWTSGLSFYNLAKVEVEGSSPFFHLSFLLLSFPSYKLFIFGRAYVRVQREEEPSLWLPITFLTPLMEREQQSWWFMSSKLNETNPKPIQWPKMCARLYSNKQRYFFNVHEMSWIPSAES